MVRCHVKVEEPLGVLHLIEDLGRIEHAGNQRTEDGVGAKLIGVEDDVHATIRFDLFEAARTARRPCSIPQPTDSS